MALSALLFSLLFSPKIFKPLLCSKFSRELRRYLRHCLLPYYTERRLHHRGSLGPVYKFVCISFRTDNLNCLTTDVNMVTLLEPKSGTKRP